MEGAQAQTLPKQYTIFGRVLTGLDVVVRIAKLPVSTQAQKPLQAVYIEGATVSVS